MSRITTPKPDPSAVCVSGAVEDGTGLRHLCRRIAAVASCVTVGMLAVPAISAATVNENSSQWGRPPSNAVVYMLQSLPGPGQTLLEDSNNSTADGAVVDTWAKVAQGVAQDPMQSSAYFAFARDESPITQANELWEFVPQSDNAGGTLTTGYGELINRQSGKCLEINNNSFVDGATVDQWDCLPGHQDEEWKATWVNSIGGYAIQSEMDGAYLSVGSSGCSSGYGDRAEARSSLSAPCVAWNPQEASYDFGTNEVSLKLIGAVANEDGTGYGCDAGYDLRLNDYSGDGQTEAEREPGVTKPTWYWDYDNVSNGNTQVGDVVTQLDNATPGDESANPNVLGGGTMWYSTYALHNTGQIVLYCDPDSTSGS